MSTNFHLAPPSKTVDGLLSVPIDIESISAFFPFNVACVSTALQRRLPPTPPSHTVGPTRRQPDLRSAQGHHPCVKDQFNTLKTRINVAKPGELQTKPQEKTA